MMIPIFCRVFGSKLYKDLKKKKWLLTKNRAPIHPHPVNIERKPPTFSKGNLRAKRCKANF